MLVDVADGILRVTLNRPETLNALTTDMLRQVEVAFLGHGRDPSVRAAILTGAGRGFCAGADIGAAGHAGPDDDAGPDVWASGSASTASSPSNTDTLEAAIAAVDAIRRFPRPVVAVTRGPVAGLGMSLALVCDLVVAADEAYFLLAFSKIGLMPDGGATALVAASIGRARAMRMSLLAERVGAQQAHDWGLISHVVPAAELETESERIVAELASGPSLAYRATKDAINQATLGELRNAFARERDGQTALLGTRDFAEGVTAFNERRAAQFDGT